MFNRKTSGLALMLLLLIACKKDTTDNDTPNTVDPTELPGDKTTWWQPAAGISFDWQLDDINSSTTFSGSVVDVDAFTTSAETVAALHAQGKKVIAYLSVGTFEDDRPDGSLLPKDVVGKKYDEWPHEKWVDIRQIDKLKPWLNSRFNMILKKGFDAIEPDNLDSYANTTGFDINIDDTKKYIDFLITTAHSNGLGIGQKNVPELTGQYASKFDWALTEDAFKQGWQNDLKLYAQLKKPVFVVEYTDETPQKTFDAQYCPAAAALGYTAILKKRDLDAWVHKCE
ncbi:endo alpha-1,4 polygalactosaminidase [Mucilaginibacter sp. UR6-1]|uniref:endo alpha-1,4 polygalactosaminidase n=1 Tax=Mucilaginibacter sp. UR6-1 TaxID=1435643 RepID=UPI001E3C7FCB|nr:endo alpha-1,4 polygalactosaminidase [Mucilaginibacter sp. UR6-1]MCC8407446.1 endo alpha-1,4 polygalactosaminidase [Mucilaginibacter sp. UR6-1]